MMKKNTPKNKNILYFILLFLVSFLYFFNVFIFSIIFFFYYCCTFLYKKNKIKNNDNIIVFNCNNEYENSFLYYYKEFIVNYSKSKAFLIFYNFLKILYKKKNENTNIKVLVFNYLFKRIFKFITLIPFTIFKINCLIYKRSENSIKSYWTGSSLKAIIDHILLNLYLEKIFDEIEKTKSYKIEIDNNIKFNPTPKKSFFKNSYEYFARKKDFENNSEFSIFKNTKKNENYIYKHVCKIYKIFKEDYWDKKYVLFSETKAPSMRDKNDNLIKNFLEDEGYKNKNILTKKSGPIITNVNDKNILEELRGSDIKAIANSKHKFSWQLLQDIFYNKNTMYLDEKNSIYVKNESLRDFYRRNYNYLNDESKKFLDAKEKFDSENEDKIKNMTDNEYENSLKSDYNNWSSSESDYLSDFDKRYKGGKNYGNKNYFTSDSEEN